MISIIIPTWNEEASLPKTLAVIQEAAKESSTPHEIIIVDAGSRDATVKIAQDHELPVIHSPKRQRAHQQNLGAAQATGTTLWFLHADTWIPNSSLAQIESVMQQTDCVGGGFARRFRAASPFLLITCFLAELRSLYFGLYFGDQALYVRTTTFRDIQGFRDMPVFEDFDLCQRWKSQGTMRLLSPAILTSARRFTDRGALIVTLHDFWLTLRYLLRKSPPI